MQNSIAWLVPYPLKGSGGHRTIFSHISYLIERGHLCHVYIGEEDSADMASTALRDMVEDWFGPCPAHFHAGYNVKEPVDMVVATAWWTAEVAANVAQANHKVYFVQDFEPYFFPMGDEYIQAEESYRYGLTPVTIGRWLSYLLHQHYESTCSHFEFTANKSTYHPVDSIKKEQAVCFLYQPQKPRRCPITGRDALAIVKHMLPDVTIYTYGSDEAPDFYFDHTHLGMLSLDECNRLYNRCTVGLCMSSSNPSRIPFEMMASGLPVVDLYGENTIYDMPDHGVLLAERNPSSLAGALLKILQSQEAQEQMRKGGIRFMTNRNADIEFEQCAIQIERILSGAPSMEDKALPLYHLPPFTDDLPVPPIIANESINSMDSSSGKQNFFQRLQQNRIGRVLKVVWKGYY